MFEELLRLGLAFLRAEESEIEEWRTEIAMMTDNDDVGATRKRQLTNYLCSSTPLDKQIDSAEQAYWKLEAKSTPTIRSAVVHLLALAQQRAKIEALKENRIRQREMPPEDGNVIHPEFIKLVQRLIRLGVGHSMPHKLNEDEMVIIADLFRWKAQDPLCEDRNDPWTDMFALYAGRTIEKVEHGRKPSSRSVLGSPPDERPEPGSTRYWRYKATKYPPS